MPTPVLKGNNGEKVVAKIFKIPTLFIESFTRVNTLSKTGKIVRFLTKNFYVQTSTLKKKYTPNSKEKYMCAKHKKFFADELLKWKNDIIKSNNFYNIIFNNDLAMVQY